MHWPAKVLKISPESVKVMFLDKSRLVEDKKHKFIMPFSTDVSVCEGRSSAWIKVWKEAKSEIFDQ